MLKLFEDKDASAFAPDEAVAIPGPGTTGASRVVIARGEGAHGGESAYAHGSDGGLGASGNHYVGIAVLDDAEGIADGVGAGGAGGGRRFIGAFGAEAHGDVPRSEVDDGGGNEKWRDLAGAAFEERGMLAFDHIESANAVDTALAGEQALPDCAGGIAHGADQADAGDDDPSFEVPWQITCPPWRACRCSRQHRSRCESSPRLRPGFRYRRPLRRPSRVRRYRANRRPGRPRMTRWG